jgi:hypothetical protein
VTPLQVTYACLEKIHRHIVQGTAHQRTREKATYQLTSRVTYKLHLIKLLIDSKLL